MPFCSQCGFGLREDDRFCPSCGRPQARPDGTPPSQDPRWADAEGRLIGRAKPTVVLLWITAGMAAILFVSTIFEADLLRRVHDGLATPAQAEAGDRRQAALGGAALLILVFTAIWWLLWQHRAHENLPLLGARDLRFTPGWAVGWWFIPFANLVQPLRAMRELWLASAQPAVPRAGRGTARIGWWWGLFIASRLIAVAGGVLRTSELSNFEDVIMGTNLQMISLLIEVVAAIVALTIVQDVVRLQIAGATAAQPAEAVAVPAPEKDLPADDQFYWKE